MFMHLHENRHGFRVAAALSVIWFTLFVVLVPIFHRHAGEWQPGFPGNAAALTRAAGHPCPSLGAASANTPNAPALGKAHGVNPLTDDDCPLCQWFGLGFTPPCVVALLAFAAALVMVLFDVRLTELCRRPLPRRGLRAPPAGGVSAPLLRAC